MLNIVSLSAMREKVTGPGKVVKNLMRGLDILGYPYVLNADLNSIKRLWIHDDTGALLALRELDSHICPIIGPNLYSLPRQIPSKISLESIPFIMPCKWITSFWKHFGYQGIIDVWPVGIDTERFIPTENPKTEVLVYVKKRSSAEVDIVTTFLKEKNITHHILYYGEYTEHDFINLLTQTKYVIWIGCAETQGIALEEILAMNIPILIWDIAYLGQWTPKSKKDLQGFTEEESRYNIVTSAEYFDDTCGMKIFHEQELRDAIGSMEENYQKFTPRNYILENLSLASQARAFIELYNVHYGLTYDSGFNEVPVSELGKSFHNAYLWKYIFRIYDSKMISKFKKFMQ